MRAFYTHFLAVSPTVCSNRRARRAAKYKATREKESAGEARNVLTLNILGADARFTRSRARDTRRGIFNNILKDHTRRGDNKSRFKKRESDRNGEERTGTDRA